MAFFLNSGLRVLEDVKDLERLRGFILREEQVYISLEEIYKFWMWRSKKNYANFLTISLKDTELELFTNEGESILEDFEHYKSLGKIQINEYL